MISGCIEHIQVIQVKQVNPLNPIPQMHQTDQNYKSYGPFNVHFYFSGKHAAGSSHLIQAPKYAKEYPDYVFIRHCWRLIVSQ